MVLESLARIVKVQLPAYLKRLPLPESVGGFIRLTVSEWLRLLPFLGVLALLGYLAVRPFLPKKKQQKDSLINLKIQKENPKVVNEINIEDLCLTKAYCRCWRSKTFPVCDGSHNKHNELTGDNAGGKPRSSVPLPKLITAVLKQKASQKAVLRQWLSQQP
uniref:CDGSH iron-sulfur domain-containing protein 2 n=1 Tax=Calidris pygmaea TaxID=425635 RepID=A0A8C3J8C7_9CHAR